jgi:hypothetical protein
MPQVLKPSFAGGELSPSLHARVDLSKYQTGLALARNFLIQAHGGAVNRPGLRWVGEVRSSSVAGRLIPFQFNTTDAYVLEFGHEIMRVIKNGAYVLEAARNVTAATRANPAQITTSVSHGYANGDEVYLSGFSPYWPSVDKRTFIVRNVTATTFTLEERSGAAVDSSAFAVLATTPQVARVYQITTPYTSSALPLLKTVQSADVMTLTHPGYSPRTLSRTGDAAWTLATITFAPAIAAPAAPTVTPNTTGTTSYSYQVVAVSAAGEQSLASPTTTTTTGNAVADNTVSWSAVTGAVSYSVFKLGAALYGFIGRATGTTFRDQNIKPDEGDTPPTAANPFSGAGNYPGCATYHEERLVYGRTDAKLQTLFFSQPGAYANFGTAIPTKDDDAIEVALVSRQVHEIRHLVSVSDLLILTSGGEWIAKPGGQSDAITPASIVAKAQSYRGASNVPPIAVGSMVLYVQDRGQIVRDLGYKYEVDSYTGNDLTLLSRHLFEGREIKEWGYAQAPYSVVWCVMSDGALLSLTYLREHEVWAWTRHETAGAVESVAVVPEGDEDVAYLLIARTVGGATRRYVERFATREVRDVQDAFFVDAGLSLDVPVSISTVTRTTTAQLSTTATFDAPTGAIIDVSGVVYANPDYPLASSDRFLPHPVNGRYQVRTYISGTLLTLGDYETNDYIDGTAWPPLIGGTVRRAVTTVYGLNHLEGQSVAILANGDVQPAQTVTNGAITLTRPASRIHVGLPYVAELQTLRLDAGDGSLQGRKKAIPYVTLRMERTRGLAGGPREERLYELKQGPSEYNEATGLYTGDYRLSVPGDWSTGGQLFLRQAYPLPAAVLGIIPEVVVGPH